DLILTPQWAWHEHAHEGDEPMVWIDGLDVPFIQSLQVISFQPYNQGRLAVSEGIDPSSYYGMTRPIGEMDSPTLPFLHYRWRATYPPPPRLPRGSATPYGAAAREYVPPRPGGPARRPGVCWIRFSRPGEHTNPRRHTSTSIYHAFRGSGTTLINGEPFHWE